MLSACVTPVYLHGRYVGAWADSMQMGSHFLSAMRETLPGATNLIIDEQGSLIAYPGFVTTAYVTGPAVQAYEARLRLHEVARAIRAQNREFGVISSPDGRDLIAYGHIDARWYFLMTLPTATVNAGGVAVGSAPAGHRPDRRTRPGRTDPAVGAQPVRQSAGAAGARDAAGEPVRDGTPARAWKPAATRSATWRARSRPSAPAPRR